MDLQHPFLYISLPLFCTTTTRNFLVRRFMVKMLHVSVCLFVCFFYPRSFSPWWPLAFLIFSLPLQNFHVFLPTKFASFVRFLCCPLQCRHFNFVQKDSALLFFLPKSPGGQAIYRQNAIVLEMRNFYPVTWRGGRTYGRFCENQNFLDAYFIFLPMVLRARELRHDSCVPSIYYIFFYLIFISFYQN